MDTQVRTPQQVFTQPQRLVVPLFQRPYVWNEDNQWDPLWDDVRRVADRLLKDPNGKHQPHFLGAVVIQQLQKSIGQMQERMIIDGQQRLTTLQLLLDALHGEFLRIGATSIAARVETLVANPPAFRQAAEDQFKVWPTNRDRPAFNAVMSATSPVEYQHIGFSGERMVEAHRFFSARARTWLNDADAGEAPRRAEALEKVVQHLLQLVVIDLAMDENAQEIFETLNARGAQLTAADLIKNFVFQRLIEKRVEVEQAYDTHWKEFETGFWETEVSVGRLRYPRSALFLNHWLVAKTGEEIVAREVFTRFKRFADHDSTVPMIALVAQIRRAADVYRLFVTNAANRTGPLDRLGLFGYRTSVLESEVVKPLALCLLDPEGQKIPEGQLHKALRVVESWMVRRMLVRATTKNYNQTINELIVKARGPDRLRIGDATEEYLRGQSSSSRYWPDDTEVRRELTRLPAYKRIARGRLRMVLEAIEDHKRGWAEVDAKLNAERVPRAKHAIEHVMPRKWHAHWPLGFSDENEREGLLHTLGNLTLLTGPLNSKVSNGPWIGEHSKRQGIEKHDVLLLNRELLRGSQATWDERMIQERTQEMIGAIVAIWPTPPGHRSAPVPDVQPRVRKSVNLADLIGGGAIFPGTTLFPRHKKHAHRTVMLLADGRLDVDGMTYPTPSEAATAVRGKPTNGWWFFLVDQESKRSLKNVRRDYVDSLDADADEEEDDEDDD